MRRVSYLGCRVGVLFAVLWAFLGAMDLRAVGDPVLRYQGALLDGQGGLDGLNGACSVIVSPDGRFVYVAGHKDGSIAVFERQGDARPLVQRHLYRAGLGGFEYLEDVGVLELSPDGRNLYAATSRSRLVVFERNVVTGALTFQELHSHGVDGVVGLRKPWDLLVSRDGGALYVADKAGALGVFSRNPGDGSLTFVEALTGTFEVGLGDIRAPFNLAWGLAESPDGRHLYLSALIGGITTFSRSASTGRLNFVENLELRDSSVFLPAAVEVSPEGRFVFVLRFGPQDTLDGSALLVFARDGGSGKLTHIGGCCEGFDFRDEFELGAPSLQVSEDGRHLLATLFLTAKVARFSFDTLSGTVVLEELLGADPVQSSIFLGGAALASAPGEDRFYVASNEADTLVSLRFPGATGGLEVEEVLKDGTGERVSGLETIADLEISSDGETLISTSPVDDSIAVQRISAVDGSLEQFQVIDVDGPEVFFGPRNFEISPDDHFLYLTRSARIFEREEATGQWFSSSEDPSAGHRVSTMAPDGGHFYAGARGRTGAEGVGIYSLDETSGQRTLVEVLESFETEDGTPDSFVKVTSIAVSPDSRHVYVSLGSGALYALLVYSREPATGEISLVQRIPFDVTPDRFFDNPREMTFDPAGGNLYAVSRFNGLVVFGRDLQSGELRYLQDLPFSIDDPDTFYLTALRDPTVDPTGEFLYVAEALEDTLVVYRRNLTTGRLTLEERFRNGQDGVDGLLNPRALAVSPDGQNVYVSTGVGGILTFTKGPAPCSGLATSLCLNDSRYELTVQWRTRDGGTGVGTAVAGGTEDSGLIWFFNQDNWEMLVKVLDGCAVNGHMWVFSAATTNVEYTLTVRDTVTGAVKEYFNPLGSSAAAVTDTLAFESCDGGLEGVENPGASLHKSFPKSLPSPKSSVEGRASSLETCLGEASGLCLNGDRFRVSVDWRKRNGDRGSGQAVALRSDDSGLFWFFNEQNWEMLVKVLDGCGVNGNYWVFSAATTNVEYTLTVTDTTTGMEKTYFNPLGTSASAITDTHALPACP